MSDKMPENLDECLKILDENIEILSNLEVELDDMQEDELVPDLELHELIDMTEDVHHSSKIKHAESNLVKRQSEEFI